MIEEVQKLIGPTWFDFIQEDDDDGETISLETRENGDVGEEKPGQADIEEARRIYNVLKDSGKFTASPEICDEWVMIDITKKN